LHEAAGQGLQGDVRKSAAAFTETCCRVLQMHFSIDKGGFS